MTDAEKIELLAEAMDVLPEDLHEEDNLTQNVAWDSLSMLSFMASVASTCGKRLKPAEVQAIVTVRDALDLME